MLASCSTDIMLHNCTAGTSASSYRSLSAPDKPVANLSWSPDDSHIVFLPENGCAEIIEATEKPKLKSNVPVLQTTAVTFQKTKNNVAVATKTGKLILYNVGTGAVIPSDHEVLMPVTHLDFNASDTQMAAGGVKNGGRIVLLSKFKLSSCILMPKGTGLTAMRFHKEFNQLAAGGENGIVNIWDTQEGGSVFCNSVHTSHVTDLTFVPALSIVISVSEDHSCVMHDLRHNSATIFSFGMPDSLTSVDFAPYEGYNFVLSTDIGEIYMYDLRKMCCPIFQCREHAYRINTVRYPSRAVRCVKEEVESLMVADGDKAPEADRSVVELYKAEGQFLELEESLHGTCTASGKSRAAFSKPEETVHRFEANKNILPGGITRHNECNDENAIRDGKMFRLELLKEVKGMMVEMQQEMMKRVEELRLYCSKEFVLLETLIDSKCRSLQNSNSFNNGGGEQHNTDDTAVTKKQTTFSTPQNSQQKCNEYLHIDHVLKRPNH